MVTYGASATPTYVLVDRKGVVRLYAPTRLAESELAQQIEEVLAETPSWFPARAARALARVRRTGAPHEPGRSRLVDHCLA
jgi:hypothetical protein